MHLSPGSFIRHTVVQRRKLWMTAAVSVVSAVCLPLAAQMTLHVNEKFVQVNCSAVDKKTGGEARIEDAAQVRVYEDDKLQKVRLRRADELPLTLAVLIDTSDSQGEDAWKRDKRQLRDFVQKTFRPGDRLFVATFALTIHPLLDAKATAETMDKVLARIDEMEKQKGPEVFPHKPGILAGTRVWDAMAVGAKVMSAFEGRKAVLVITDGEDNASTLSTGQVLHLAQDVSVPFFGLGVEGAALRNKMSGQFGHQMSGNHDPQPLIDLVEGSGGKVFTETSDEAVAKQYALLAQYLRSQFVLEYRVADGSPPGFHKIRVEPVEKSVTVFAKKGVWRQ